MLQSTAFNMVAQFQERLPPAAVGTVNSALSSAIAYASTALATSPIPAGIAATIVALNNGVITPAVARLTGEINAKKAAMSGSTGKDPALYCAPPNPRDTPTECLTERWLMFLVNYIPVVVPVAVAVIVRRAKMKVKVKVAAAKAVAAAKVAQANAMKDTLAAAAAATDPKAMKAMRAAKKWRGNKAGAPEKQPTEPLIKVNSAVMAANLITSTLSYFYLLATYSSTRFPSHLSTC